MLEVVIFTLFPEMFEGVLGESILKRAIEQGLLDVKLVNFRDYATDKHKTVDDYPFGGGVGMLLKPKPLFDAVRDVAGDSLGGADAHVVLLTPQGKRFTQRVAEDLSHVKKLYLLCGHYEGFDERIRQHLVTDEISIGDFVMTGGEIAAMAIVDSVARLLPGALGNQGSADDDSFTTGLLEYPQYTRPADFEGLKVPDVLLSGHHEQVAKWRHRHALYRTWLRRRDLLAGRILSGSEQKMIARWESGDFSDIDVLN